MKPKQWMAIALTGLALVACAGPVVQPVARFDNVVLTRQELDRRIELVMAGQGAEAGQQAQPREEIERSLVDQFVNQNLTFELARQKQVVVEEQEVDDLIESFRTRFAQSNNSLDTLVRAQLGLPGGASSEFRQFVTFLIAQRKLSETMVTTDTVRQLVVDQITALREEKVDQVHAAHILVDTEEQAEQIIERLKKGESFEDLAREFSKDTASGGNGGDVGWASRNQFVPEFDKAIFEQLKPGEITQTPVKSQFGYHIIKVIERENRPRVSAEEANAMIEQGIQDQLPRERQRVFDEAISRAREKAIQEGRLIVPAASAAQPTAPPTPTPSSS